METLFTALAIFFVIFGLLGICLNIVKIGEPIMRTPAGAVAGLLIGAAEIATLLYFVSQSC